MPPAKDFVILTRLNAQLTEDPTGVKTHHDQDSSKSVWQRTLKPIGSGGMGEVYREQCITGENAGALRAVKAIQKPNPRIASKINLDYSRELEALARFSQPQVYLSCVYQRLQTENFRNSISDVSSGLMGGTKPSILSLSLWSTSSTAIYSSTWELLCQKTKCSRLQPKYSKV